MQDAVGGGKEGEERRKTDNGREERRGKGWGGRLMAGGYGGGEVMGVAAGTLDCQCYQTVVSTAAADHRGGSTARDQAGREGKKMKRLMTTTSGRRVTTDLHNLGCGEDCVFIFQGCEG